MGRENMKEEKEKQPNRGKEDRVYSAWLSSVWQIRGEKKRRLAESLGDAEAVYRLKRETLNKIDILTEREKGILWEAITFYHPQQIWEGLQKEKIEFLPYYERDFPRRLKEIKDMPYGIYFRGRLPREDKRTVAIVGARRCSRYGEKFALEYGDVLGRSGVQIISGMARGIDGVAQRGAMNGGGYSCGILGSGVNICYPGENRGLYMDLQERGCILSEYPPGTQPRPELFPRRNRLISGLSDVTIIIEAREKSGSFITADFALEQGKDVYALPGAADSKLSAGCHRLIAQGAGILLSPRELLKDMGVGEEEKRPTEKKEKVLEKEIDIVYSCVGLSPKSVHQLSEETDLAGPILLERLITLELMGYIEEVSKNYYRRI